MNNSIGPNNKGIIRKLLNITSILLIVLFVLISGYIVYSKFIKTDKEAEKSDIVSGYSKDGIWMMEGLPLVKDELGRLDGPLGNDKSELAEIKLPFDSDKNITLDNKSVVIKKVIKTSVKIDCNGDYIVEVLYVNNKKYMELSNSQGFYNFYIFNNKYLIVLIGSNCVGASRGTAYVFNSNFKELYKFNYFDDGKNQIYALKDRFYYHTCEKEENSDNQKASFYTFKIKENGEVDLKMYKELVMRCSHGSGL